MKTDSFSQDKRIEVHWNQLPFTLLSKLVVHADAFHSEVQSNRKVTVKEQCDSSKIKVKRKRGKFEKTKWG
jgi:hypothetical protein